MIFKNLAGSTKNEFSLGDPSLPKVVLGAIEWDETNVLFTTTSTSFVDARSFTTVSSLPVGFYQIDYTAVAGMGTAAKLGEIQFLFDGSVVGSVQQMASSLNNVSKSHVFTSFVNLLTEATHTMKIQVRYAGGGSSLVRVVASSMSIRRVK